MAVDILQRYGIKEVADVTFYHIDKVTNEPDYPVLILDSLKVTSIEQTAEQTEARGGKGNAKLIVWDFGKEITVNIEDALFSPKSLSIMLANGAVDDYTETINRSARVVATKDGEYPKVKIDGEEITAEIKYYDGNVTDVEGGNEATVDAGSVTKGQILHAVWKQKVKNASTFTVTADSFPGTYYVTGDTMVRSERNGEDEYFQFIIKKAKMQPEQTISMEAEGDPSTFNMSLQVLRPEDGEMIKFIKYELDFTTDGGEEEENEVTGDDPLTTE